MDLLQLKIDALLKGKELQVQGDFNARVGDDQHSSWPEIVGKFELGRANDKNYSVQMISPDRGTLNKIGYILVRIREDTFIPESITDVIRYRRFRWFWHV